MLSSQSTYSFSENFLFVVFTRPCRGGDTVKSVQKQWDVLANLLVDAIQLACEAKRDSITEPALDCLQVCTTNQHLCSLFKKLLIYGYIQVATPDLTNGGSSGLMARVIKVVSGCLRDNNTQNVEVQMIKVSHTARTTAHIDIGFHCCSYNSHLFNSRIELNGGHQCSDQHLLERNQCGQ